MKNCFYILLCYMLGTGVLLADTTYPVTCAFEKTALWGKTPKYGLDDETGDPTSTLSTYWYCWNDAENASLITTYTNDDMIASERYDFSKFAPTKPSYMRDKSNNFGFLEVSTPYPLIRTFTLVASPSGPSIDGCVAIPERGLYIDTLVKFTESKAFKSADAIAEAGDKINFWLYANPDTGHTNLVVTAGTIYADGSVGFVNYLTTYEFTTRRWARLTVRATRNVSTVAQSEDQYYTGFVVYIDGEQVVCEKAVYQAAIGSRAAKIFSGNDDYENCALFPSMRTSDGALRARSIYGLTMKGAGRVDEINLTNTDPLAKAADKVEVKLVCTEGAISNVVVKIDGEEVTNIVGAVNGSVFEVSPGDRVELEPGCYFPNRVADEFVFTGNLNVLRDHSGHSFTMVSGGEFADGRRLVVTMPTETAYFRVGDYEYATFFDAVEAATYESDDHIIALQSDLFISSEERNDLGQAWVLPGQVAVLDLHGKKLKGDHFKEEATVYNQGTFKIIDSVGGGSVEAPGTVIENDWTALSDTDAVEVNHDFASLTMGSFESKLFSVRGRVKCTRGKLSVVSGDYLTPASESKDVFYLATNVADRCTTNRHDEAEGTYWTVSYDESLIVDFVAPYGEWTPHRVNVPKGGTVVRPTVVAPGYTQAVDVAGAIWTNKSGVAWNFDEVVTKDMTLYAAMGLEKYSIVYDRAVAGNPSSYSVELTPPVTLKIPSSNNFAFVGWQVRDSSPALFVTNVGAGAVYRDTQDLVLGNLDLVSRWAPESLKWSNAEKGVAESNGTYWTAWPMIIPAGKYGLTYGDKIVLDEIAFAIVNPLEFKQTAKFIAVTNASYKTIGASNVSAERPIWIEGGEYTVGTNRLANGRTKVSYRFPAGLELMVGGTNGVVFVTGEGGTTTTGFLRFAKSLGDGVMGMSPDVGGNPESAEYEKFYPVYEIYGHVKEGGEP